MNEKFQVKIKEEFGKPALSTTRNGYQWTSMVIHNPAYEIPLIIDALQRHLSEHAADAESRCVCQSYNERTGDHVEHCPCFGGTAD